MKPSEASAKIAKISYLKAVLWKKIPIYTRGYDALEDAGSTTRQEAEDFTLGFDMACHFTENNNDISKIRSSMYSTR